ncbi:hypothetical protein [Aquabacterium sp. J223]|uniref:hypothetical protein n=1 Tax=Aquabacterium sp. J223 TaxID=2898431 RepID=UPI0021AD6C8E|nr:hypothetical protein [Aquabacterium sp. J223]UUX94839.1 hypothetical protein LRS07_16415 [Aquabacterium sp. J223]
MPPRPLRSLLLIAALAGGAATAQDLPSSRESSARLQSLPASMQLGYERVKLPGGEVMGLAHGAYLVELRPGWWAGPIAFGAATGQRGGLFTWGAELQRRWVLGPRLGIVTGASATGGGGANAPVGGGLMLRPHVDLLWDRDGWQSGFSLSQVRFPTGRIASTQFGIVLMRSDRFVHTAPGVAGRRNTSSVRGGVGFDRMEPIVGRYTGTTGGSPLSYVGIRLERDLEAGFAAGMEAAGAAQGSADGYAEVFGSLSGRWPVLGQGLLLGGRAALGLGGGGAVPTGGGQLLRAGVVATWLMRPQLALNVELGRVIGLNGELSARHVQASLSLPLGGLETGRLPDQPAALNDMEWSLALQDWRDVERRAGGERSMQLIGLKFRSALDERWYLTGHAVSAAWGGAGAFSTGLVGLGWNTRLGPDSGWRIGLEALAGAAGGGGVSNQGGAVYQPLVWVGRDLGRHARLQVGGGRIRSLRGALDSPVLDVTLSIAFGTP